MQTFPTLFKRTSTGKVQIWFAEVDGNRYRTTSGQLDGKKTTAEWTVAKPKNIGKANELSASEQAVAEVNAMYTKQKKSDYHENVDTVDVAMRIKPMLATKWADEKTVLLGNISAQNIVWLQPKLDGMRCIATASGLFSRNGETIHGAPHVHAALTHLFQANPDLILDGELYNHDLADDFNKIMSSAKKKKPTAADLAVSRQNIQYWVYDLPSMSSRPWSERFTALQGLIVESEHIILTETVEAPVGDVDAIAADYIERRFEGAMVRLDRKYENKRSKSLIKWKEFQDAEFEIVDIQDGDGNRTGIAARVILRLPDGRTFGAGVIGNHEYCRQLLKDKAKHIGKQGTVVFQNYTPDGVPRFPKFKAVRDYE